VTLRATRPANNQVWEEKERRDIADARHCMPYDT
jgi:hypothetical protein